MNLYKLLTIIFVALLVFTFTFPKKSNNGSVMHIEDYKDSFEVHISFHTYDESGTHSISNANNSSTMMTSMKYFLESMSQDNDTLQYVAPFNMDIIVVCHDSHYLANNSIIVSHDHLSGYKIDHVHIRIQSKAFFWKHLDSLFQRFSNIIKKSILFIKSIL